MSKVITFSRTFPAYHPKAGEKTFFVEKIWKSINIRDWTKELEMLNPKFGPFDINDSGEIIDALGNEIIEYTGYPKHHTIRSGNRWKVGDKFSPRVWSGKPYCSPQIIIAPDIEIKQIWDVEVDSDLSLWVCSNNEGDPGILEKVALNDGLSLNDLMAWFNKPMIGQIICWDDSVNY